MHITKVNCPTCSKVVIWDETSRYRPFCSKRCQQIDFGEWATASHSIPGEKLPYDMDEDNSHSEVDIDS